MALAFPLIYLQCFGCNSNTSESIQFLYYAPLVIIFQFGWASTQINHLALIPDLAKGDGDKVTLNTLRYCKCFCWFCLFDKVSMLPLEKSNSRCTVTVGNVIISL